MPLIYFTVQKMVLLDGKENRFGTNFLLHLSDHLYSGLCIKMTPFMSYLIGCLYVLKSNAQSTSKLTNSSEQKYFFTSFEFWNVGRDKKIGRWCFLRIDSRNYWKLDHFYVHLKSKERTYWSFDCATFRSDFGTMDFFYAFLLDRQRFHSNKR